MKTHSFAPIVLEILENRIAPASLFTYMDIDGDLVKITSTKGDLTANGVVNLSGDNAGDPTHLTKPHELQSLSLDSTFAGAAITVTATPQAPDAVTHAPNGDGFANVGLIDAGTIDLASVTIHGDLAKIVVGDDNTTNTKPGLGSLKVQSIGKYGTSTLPTNNNNDIISRFINGVGSITVASDVTGAFLHATASGALPTAKIGSVTINGDLIGGSASDSGEIVAADGIGTIKVHNIIGGSGTQSGRIGTGLAGNIKSITVSGSIQGGTNNQTGIIDGGAGIGSVSVLGDIVGGTDFRTGLIRAATSIGKATVGGSLVGGTNSETGGIEAATTIASVKVTNDLRGIDFSNANNFKQAAFVSAKDITTVTIGGSLISGLETGGGVLQFSASVQADEFLGTVKIGGDVIGNTATPVVISGGGFAGAAVKPSNDTVIKSLTVAGTVNNALIETGFDSTGKAVDGDASIGAIKIGGDLIATSIGAGIDPGANGFGDVTDAVISKHNTAAILAKIASITVAGQIAGTVGSGDDFAIEAQLIGSIKTGGVALPLQVGNGNDNFRISQTTTHDVLIREFTGT